MSKAVDAKKLNVASDNSMPLHNRFDMFNNTVLFPENVCKSVTSDQEMVCLHSKQRDEQFSVPQN